jgi:uncharacterized cupin superfamily protein
MKIDLAKAPVRAGCTYPSPHDLPCRDRRALRLGDAAGLTRIGVNLLELAPGVWSSQRHWHTHEDEFVWVLEGEVVLVDDAGEHVLAAGDCAGFAAGDRNGHCLQNRSSAPARLLVVGNRDDADRGEYADLDLQFLPGRYSGGGGYLRKNGDPV